MTRKHFVIDTGYLVELYKVPNFGDAHSRSEIRSRFEAATNRQDRFLLPAVVIFETANHIAGVGDGNLRRALAERLRQDVVNSIESTEPFIIVPHLDSDALVALVTKFAEEFAAQALSLTDSSIVAEALRRSKDRPGEFVHIWTRDEQTKAREPDAEEDPFV